MERRRDFGVVDVTTIQKYHAQLKEFHSNNPAVPVKRRKKSIEPLASDDRLNRIDYLILQNKILED